MSGTTSLSPSVSSSPSSTPSASPSVAPQVCTVNRLSGSRRALAGTPLTLQPVVHPDSVETDLTSDAITLSLSSGFGDSVLVYASIELIYTALNGDVISVTQLPLAPPSCSSTILLDGITLFEHVTVRVTFPLAPPLSLASPHVLRLPTDVLFTPDDASTWAPTLLVPLAVTASIHQPVYRTAASLLFVPLPGFNPLVTAAVLPSIPGGNVSGDPAVCTNALGVQCVFSVTIAWPAVAVVGGVCLNVACPGPSTGSTPATAFVGVVSPLPFVTTPSGGMVVLSAGVPNTNTTVQVCVGACPGAWNRVFPSLVYVVGVFPLRFWF